MEEDNPSTSEKKFYRIDWKFIDLDKGIDEDYAYVAAANPEEAIYGIPGEDFTVREATKEEVEAYVAGYEDGYDIAVITERFKETEEDEQSFLSIEELGEAINKLEERARKEEEDR